MKRKKLTEVLSLKERDGFEEAASAWHEYNGSGIIELSCLNGLGISRRKPQMRAFCLRVRKGVRTGARTEDTLIKDFDFLNPVLCKICSTLCCARTDALGTLTIERHNGNNEEEEEQQQFYGSSLEKIASLC
eukprot:jgi/Bigna1/80169/fgenesh1_pg.68_\